MNVTFLKPDRIAGHKHEAGESAFVPDDLANTLIERGIATGSTAAMQMHTHLVSMFTAAHGKPVLIKT